MRGMGGFRDGSGFMMDGTHRSKGQLSFPSRQNSVLSHISEMESEEAMEGSSPRERSGDGRSFISAFSVASWDESSLFNNSFSGLERGREGEEKMTAGLISLEPQVTHHSLLVLLHSVNKHFSERTNHASEW